MYEFIHYFDIFVHYFCIIGVPVSLWAIFARRGKTDPRRSKMASWFLPVYNEFEPQWYIIASRVFFTFVLLFALSGLTQDYYYTQPKIYEHFHNYFLWSGSALLGVGIFRICAIGERRKYKQQMMKKDEPASQL